MKYSVITGDIISSTSLQQEDKVHLEYSLQQLLQDLRGSFNIFGRIVKGDNFECVAENAGDGLKIALAIKSFVKAIPVDIHSYAEKKKRAKHFKEHGIRLAVGYGELSRVSEVDGVMDGEAIYLSGRLINSKATYNKERIVIKNTLFFASHNEELNRHFRPVFELLDVLLAKATARQCEVLYLKLLGNDEKAISEKLGIDQSVVNRHSTSVGWNAIETAVNYFSETMNG